MAQAIQGKDLVLFFRALKNKATDNGAKLKFQTEHEIAKEKESSTTTTKDGVIVSVSDGESSASITSMAYREGDETPEVWKELESYFKANEIVEIWEVDLGSKTGVVGSETYEVEYYQGYFTSFNKTAPADDKVELSIEYLINGNGASGTDTLTTAQQTALNQYEYENIAQPVI